MHRHAKRAQQRRLGAKKEMRVSEWKTTKSCRRTKNNLPILPEDIESQILELLEFVQDVAVARMVCKRWKRLVDENSQLWRRLKGLTLPKRLPNEAEKWYAVYI